MIKTVQIRSFVKGGNHGQYLQALGLAELVKSLLPHAQVAHLDYENHFAKELKIQTFAGMLPKFLTMRYYWDRNLEFTKLGNQADLSIYGSDMIWHLDSDLFLPDPMMFGEKDQARTKISYAPSVGYRIDDEPDWIAPLLDDFKAIGVRDENSANMVSQHSDVAPEFVIDPCFHLMNSKKYSSWFLNEQRQNFVSVYSPLSHRFVSAFQENLDYSELPDWLNNFKYLGYFPRKRFLQDLGKQFTDPLWTVQQIARSKLLITSTFHGVMMALMTKTPFIAVTSPNLTARLQSPIAKAFAQNRLMTMDEFNALSNSKILEFMDDSDLNQEELNRYISDSVVWLQNALSELGDL